MDNMTFGKYIPGNSLIHRLDPRLKICTVLIFLIAVFFDVGFIGYGILAIYVLGCILLSKIKVSHILKAVKPMVFMMLFFNDFLTFFLLKNRRCSCKNRKYFNLFRSFITNSLYFYKTCFDHYLNNANDINNKTVRVNTRN